MGALFLSQGFYARCTKQACAFAAAHGEYEALGVPVVGVSKDSQKSHQRFAEKNGLPFLLLSDPN